VPSFFPRFSGALLDVRTPPNDRLCVLCAGSADSLAHAFERTSSSPNADVAADWERNARRSGTTPRTNASAIFEPFSLFGLCKTKKEDLPFFPFNVLAHCFPRRQRSFSARRRPRRTKRRRTTEVAVEGPSFDPGFMTSSSSSSFFLHWRQSPETSPGL